MSKSGFLLTADPWKTGSVSNSAFLLTAGLGGSKEKEEAGWMNERETNPGYSEELTMRQYRELMLRITIIIIQTSAVPADSFGYYFYSTK